jgi:predicted XRE-type DNA-binding protein
MCSTDLGLARYEASALKVKATLLGAILRREIENRGSTQRQLVEILDEYQPSVSNLIREELAKCSLFDDPRGAIVSGAPLPRPFSKVWAWTNPNRETPVAPSITLNEISCTTLLR